MMARLRVSTWSALAVGIGFLLSEAIMLDARIRDYDEGVYWATFRALARGEPMFSTVFATSPPGFFYALLPFYLVVQSLASLRAGVLLLCLAGLAATYVMGGLLAGNLGGLVAVLLSATSSVYWHESTVLQADGPSLALSTVAVALAMLAVRTEAGGRGRPGVGVLGWHQVLWRGGGGADRDRVARGEPRPRPAGDRRGAGWRARPADSPGADYRFAASRLQAADRQPSPGRRACPLRHRSESQLRVPPPRAAARGAGPCRSGGGADPARPIGGHAACMGGRFDDRDPWIRADLSPSPSVADAIPDAPRGGRGRERARDRPSGVRHRGRPGGGHGGGWGCGRYPRSAADACSRSARRGNDCRGTGAWSARRLLVQ